MRLTIYTALAALVLILGKATAELPTHPDDAWGNEMDRFAPPQDMDCYNPDGYDETDRSYLGNLREQLAQTLAVWYRFAHDTDKYEEWICNAPDHLDNDFYYLYNDPHHLDLGRNPRPATLPQNYQARPGPSPRWLSLEDGGGFMSEGDLGGSKIHHLAGQPWEHVNWRRHLVFSGISSQEWMIWPYACKEVMAREIEAFLHLQCSTLKTIQQRYSFVLGEGIVDQINGIADDIRAEAIDAYFKNMADRQDYFANFPKNLEYCYAPNPHIPELCDSIRWKDRIYTRVSRSSQEGCQLYRRVDFPGEQAPELFYLSVEGIFSYDRPERCVKNGKAQ